MIQPIQTSKKTWFLYWVDFEEPVSGQNQEYFLPTLIIVCDDSGTPVAAPEVFDELDQLRVENLLTGLFDKLGPPQRLAICDNDEWDPEAWRTFGGENRIEIRFQKFESDGPGSLRSLARTVVMRFSREGTDPTDPTIVAQGLVLTAMRIRSATKRIALLRCALQTDTDCQPARLELADLDFQNGNWKQCLTAYEIVITREVHRWQEQTPDWWNNRETRILLRGYYGRAMTLWHQGNHGAAADGFEKLLNLNPVDHQGTRFFIPLLRLLADELESAVTFFEHYQANYPDDYIEPAFAFAWALTLSLIGQETEAKQKYRSGILKNFYLAPMLLEEPEPERNVWHPNDRAEPNYAAEFIDSYAVLWDREPGALRLLRESWHEIQSTIAKIQKLRTEMVDFQDQRYQTDYKAVWKKLIETDEKLTS